MQQGPQSQVLTIHINIRGGGAGLSMPPILGAIGTLPDPVGPADFSHNFFAEVNRPKLYPHSLNEKLCRASKRHSFVSRLF
jgi:hypothetical protein